MYRRRIDGRHNFNQSTEIVEFLKNYHNFKYSRHDGASFFQVFRLKDALLQPECELDKKKELLLMLQFISRLLFNKYFQTS